MTPDGRVSPPIPRALPRCGLPSPGSFGWCDRRRVEKHPANGRRASVLSGGQSRALLVFERPTRGVLCHGWDGRHVRGCRMSVVAGLVPSRLKAASWGPSRPTQRGRWRGMRSGSCCSTRSRAGHRGAPGPPETGHVERGRQESLRGRTGDVGKPLRARIFRRDLATGRRELWKEVRPPDQTGLVYVIMVVSADGRAYAYTLPVPFVTLRRGTEVVRAVRPSSGIRRSRRSSRAASSRRAWLGQCQDPARRPP